MNELYQQLPWWQRLPDFYRLMRLNRPIGTLLLLWPTLWALWLAAAGLPDLDILIIFVAGVVVMRAAGCVINDFADRHIDGHVKRTKERPLATGHISSREALTLFTLLCLSAFALVLLTDMLTIQLSIGGVLLASLYPFMKRYTHLPQVVLGAAFSWAIPMAFAAQSGTVPTYAWLLFAANLLWTVAYDTMYAMVDRDDDLKIGVKSTAVLFGHHDRLMVGLLQLAMLGCLAGLGNWLALGPLYYLGLIGAAGLFVYQHWLIRHRERMPCLQAFLNNNWAGMAIFAGLLLHYA